MCIRDRNSKDQTFDRDLLAMRTYFDCGLIDVLSLIHILTVFQLRNCIGSEDSREGIDHVRKIQEKQGEKGGGNGVSVQQIQIKLYGLWPGTFVVMLPTEPVKPMEQERNADRKQDEISDSVKYG